MVTFKFFSGTEDCTGEHLEQVFVSGTCDDYYNETTGAAASQLIAFDSATTGVHYMFFGRLGCTGTPDKEQPVEEKCFSYSESSTSYEWSAETTTTTSTSTVATTAVAETEGQAIDASGGAATLVTAASVLLIAAVGQ